MNKNLSVIACHSGNQNTHFWQTLKFSGTNPCFTPPDSPGLSGSKQYSSLQPPSLNNLSHSGKTYLHIFTYIIKQKQKAKVKNKPPMSYNFLKSFFSDPELQAGFRLYHIIQSSWLSLLNLSSTQSSLPPPSSLSTFNEHGFPC